MIVAKSSYCKLFYSRESVSIPGRASFLFLLLLVGFSSPAIAEPKEATLFSGGAMRKAEEQYRGRARGKYSAGESYYTEDSAALGDLIGLETAQDLIDDPIGGDMFSRYRPPLSLLYFSNVTNIDDYFEWENRSAAERMFAYQSFSALSKVVSESALKPLYERALHGFKWFRNYTSVKFNRSESGNLDLAEPTYEEPIMELKLHISANNGVEPRLEIGDNLMVRHNIFDQETLFEFRTNF